MTYFGILIYAMLYPQTGRRMRESWDSPYQNAWTKFMSKGRYLQITSVLHFNDNSDVARIQKDSLHKIRPLLTILKRTLGRYAILGNEHSFDEATMACKSSYGRHLIVYNGAKPTGKFHFKMYMMCCAKTNLTHKIKIHTRDNCDKDIIEDEAAIEAEVTKIDALTLEMCKSLFNTGSVVNMDNYYMSTTCAMKLRANGVFCRGTIRSSRKFVPKSILFTPAEVRQLPRGTQRCVVNEDHQMLAIGWIDNKAVHFVSTADTTTTVVVTRRAGSKKLDISAPVAIKNYNKFMGGVDRHDRLRSTFSLCKAHKFRKYYVKLFLFIVDVGITNAWIYYKMANPDSTKKYGTRADFFQSIAEAMVNQTTNWAGKAQEETTTDELEDDDINNENNCVPCATIPYPTEVCMPVPLHSLSVTLSTKKKVCQVCNYEMRPFKWKSVTLCSKHGVRLCTEIVKPRQYCLPNLKKKDGSLVTDWSWTCPMEKSCWAKFHEFYQPHGLFNSYFYIDNIGKSCKFSQCIYTSPLYQKKYAALGVEIKSKRGHGIGMGRINERDHMVQLVEDEEGNK